MMFNKILIPVDFTVNTEVAIQKGVDLCEGENPSIHLLHVPNLVSASAFGYYRYLTSFNLNSDLQLAETKRKMEECANYIRQLRNDIQTYCWITFENGVEKAISIKGTTINADLIIIGKNSRHSVLPFLNTVVPTRIAKRTSIPVLTVKPGALSNAIRTVVVPIGSKYPAKKVEIINYLVNRSFIHIRLLLLAEKNDDTTQLQTSLFSVCRFLKYKSLGKISYEVLHVENKAADILNYCQKVDADLLIVHPESETRIGWLDKQIPDQLPVSSKTQVLAVSQNNLSAV